MVLFSSANGNSVCVMAEVNNYGRMVAFIRVIGKAIWLMEKED
jgi:hypothetical protein